MSAFIIILISCILSEATDTATITIDYDNSWAVYVPAKYEGIIIATEGNIVAF